MNNNELEDNIENNCRVNMYLNCVDELTVSTIVQDKFEQRRSFNALAEVANYCELMCDWIDW